jgi:hypothetical protein
MLIFLRKCPRSDATGLQVFQATNRTLPTERHHHGQETIDLAGTAFFQPMIDNCDRSFLSSFSLSNIENQLNIIICHMVNSPISRLVLSIFARVVWGETVASRSTSEAYRTARLTFASPCRPCLPAVRGWSLCGGPGDWKPVCNLGVWKLGIYIQQ